MKLKKITLNNIRSYEQQEIEFPEGSTLLSGDIGSGKTSILLGIEFALFGLQPGQKGSSLLRNGEDSGGVAIEFEIDGKEILIERTLKRKKTISQDYCSIKIDGEKEEISVMELKDRVLNLLNYPKEFSKKQNILYKFTVYTPQEEMKQIILEDSVTRINTLRHVFGIDKYKKILENVSIITAKMREEKRIKQGFTENLERDREELASREDDLESKHYSLSSIEKEFFLKKEKRKKVQEEKEEIAKRIEEKIKFEQEIEKTKIIISNKSESVDTNIKMMGELKKQIKDLEDLRFDESEIPSLEQEIEITKKEKEEFMERKMEITAKINSLDSKNQENENIKNKLKHLEICPTCLQDVGPVYKSNVVNKLDSDISANLREIESLNLEKRSLLEKIGKVDEENSLKEKKIQELEILKLKFQTMEEKQNRVEEIEKLKFSLERDIRLLDEHMGNLKNSVFELKKFDNIFELKQKELEEASSQERAIEIKIAELKKEIEVFSINIEEMKERIKKIEEIKEQLNYISKLEDWLSQKFVPVISFIEKNVMVRLHAQFSRLFAEWFDMLVSDTFNVRLSEDFTPIVEYHDYEIDYSYLSGGERTAIALAYRLALNQVINSLLSKIKTRDIVILDEPTDGFSEKQLDKIRDVLQQLNINQLIIVSHEQKIEGFVENLIRFKKVGGISMIEE